MKLWIDKHKPNTLDEMAGQGAAIKQTLNWLTDFSPGQGLLLSGPSGIGKTLLVEILAKEKNWDLQRMNASDKRGKNEINEFTNVTKTLSLFHKGKAILIDELDGISGRDRGAVTAIANLVKTSQFPVFLVAINPNIPKLRPLKQHCQAVKFTRVPTPSITKRLRELAKKEDLSASDSVLQTLARWSQGDLRSAITDLQMVSLGKKEVTEKDLELLGYRERESSIFDILPTLFRSGSIRAGRKAIFESDKDPDELFWWVESNLLLEFPVEALPRAYELLSQANLFRARVMKQQNWRFKGYMSNLLAAISLLNPEPSHRYVPYKPPDRILLMGRTKIKRAILKSLCQKIGGLTHTSTKVVKRDYLPYLKLILKKHKEIEGLELEPEEMKLLQS